MERNEEDEKNARKRPSRPSITFFESDEVEAQKVRQKAQFVTALSIMANTKRILKISSSMISVSYFIAAAVLLSFSAYGGQKWEGVIPAFAREPEPWESLIQGLKKSSLPHGVMAASQRMLTFFTDLSSKEHAYQNIVEMVDMGYPFSTLDWFVFGDLDSDAKEPFMESYNLYKATMNEQKGMAKWAKYYFDKLDAEKSRKYRFFQAIEKYRKKDPPGAKKILEDLLAEPSTPREEVFIKKVSRTLARIYFEEEKYSESLDVYENFLLKVNPIASSDWLEAAWNHYHLKDYEKALGYLFNLESKSIDSNVSLEKYIIRALIFREYCAVNNMKELVDSFETDFGPSIAGIKGGEPLLQYPALKQIFHPKNRKFYSVFASLTGLNGEKEKIDDLPSGLRELADYLYKSEINRLRGVLSLYADEAVNGAAEHLIMLSEGVRFLTFDVARQKYNPDMVFQEPEKESRKLIEQLPNRRFLIHWNQTGDFWRDERHLYLGKINSQCSGS